MYKAIRVWADIDEKIAPLVEYLNTIPQVRTVSSCQGCRCQGDDRGPWVMCYCSQSGLSVLEREFNVTPHNIAPFRDSITVTLREGWECPIKPSGAAGTVMGEHGHVAIPVLVWEDVWDGIGTVWSDK